MKKFILDWFIAQVLLLGFIGWMADLDQAKWTNNDTVNCSSVGYVIGVTIIDVTVPLIQFSHFGTRKCSTGTN